MKIDIASVNGNGDYDKEYVTLKVNEACDAGRFILTDTTYTDDGKFSSLLRHVFWLPDRQVNVGDYIFVYTKSGKTNSFANKSGTTTHTFYWGLKTAVWNDVKDCAVLIEAATWQFKASK